MSSTPILGVESLHKRYGDQIAIDDFSFHVRHGQCFGLLGPNGTGKTTTLRMLLGVTVPDAGSLRLYDEPVPEAAYHARMCVGVVSQFDNLDPDFSVSENLRIFGHYFGLSAATIRERTPTLLGLARLEQKADALVRAFSDGVRRWLTVARAPINDPDIPVMDKPTTGLDPQARHLIWERLRSLLAAGKTILLTMHSMGEAERLHDELRVIDNGRKVVQGKLQKLIACEIGCDVVEVYGDDLNALRTLPVPPADRVEISGETFFCYARDPQPLVAVLRTQAEAHIMPGPRYLCRSANLEDVSLCLTGHEIRD